MNHTDILNYYRSPGPFTNVERFAKEIEALPSDTPTIARFVQGLLVHEALAPLYSLTLPTERSSEKQLHRADEILARALGMDTRPLSTVRTPKDRVVCVCRHFATLFVAILRHKHIPARARCGFANYFEPGKHVDHWVGEYWHDGQARWILVDAQIDEVQARVFRPDFDVLDVPRSRFLVAGDAWSAYREGRADPQTFGVAGTANWGPVEIFGDIWQDVAALRKIELLPWGWYGMALDESSAERETVFVDRLAAVSSAADPKALTELMELASRDDRLVVPLDRLQAK